MMFSIKLSAIFASVIASQTDAFAPARRRVGTRLSKFVQNPSYHSGIVVSDPSFTPFISSPLFYRAHEERDDDDTLSRLRTRAAPTFQKSEIEKSAKKRQRGVNGQLITSLIINQIIILTLAAGLTALYVFFSGNEQFYTEGILNWNGVADETNDIGLDLSLTPIRFIQGLLGSIPTISLSQRIERSDDRKYSQTNFSTVFMVMTLFGRRSSSSKVKGDKRIKVLDNLDPITNTFDVAFIAAGLSYLTGCCEEIVFRGFLPHVLKSTICQGNSVLACIGQASLFALGHSSPKTSKQENKTVVSIQFFNGLWEGVLYLLVGGDIVPCIIAHTILFFTWVAVNDQLDYSFERSLDPVPGDSFKEVQEIKRQLGAKLPETAFEVCKRVFFIFDEDKNGFISRSEVQRGISYLGVEGLIVAPSQTTVDSVFDSCIQMRDKNGIKVRKEVMDQLRFADFLRLFLTIKAVGSSVMAR